jgi:hypothetical protein
LPRWAQSSFSISGVAEDLPEQRANGMPRDDRNDDVRHKDSKKQQK